VNKIFIFFLIFLFLNNCSFNAKSKFWTKETNIKKKVKKTNKKDLFVAEEALQKELNPSLEIKLIKTKLVYNKTNRNNNSVDKYLGEIKKISKFKFSKIEYFDQYEPEILFEKENIIFFDNKGTIIKFDKNSDLIWKKNHYSKQEKKINPFLFFSKQKDVLIVVDTISKYYAVDINNGKLLWSFYNNAPFISGVKIENNKIFVVDSNNTLKCFSLKDGSLIWEYKSDTNIIKSSKQISIAIDGNKVLFNNSIGDIHAIEIDTGNLIWIAPTAEKLNLIQPYLLKISDLVIQNNSVLFSNNNNEFFSININTGFINWKQKINTYIRPAIVNDLIFTFTLEGFLVIIDNPTGNIVRVTDVFDQFKKKKRDKIKPVGFSINETNIFLSTNQGKLLIIDILTGKTKSTLKIDKGKISRPFFSNNNLYLIKENSIIKLN
jgi:outer membrane protein assembly factor BamB